MFCSIDKGCAFDRKLINFRRAVSVVLAGFDNIVHDVINT
jgi:hypothetical protein